MEYYIKIICTKNIFFCTTTLPCDYHDKFYDSFKQKKKDYEMLKVEWNWYMQFHRLHSHSQQIFFATSLTQVTAEVSYLVVCISWSIRGCRIFCLRQPWKYYENTNGEKMRTLLAGYSFIGFAHLCFQRVTSSSQMPIFNWSRDQTIKLLSI